LTADGILLKRIVADLIKGRKNMVGNGAWNAIKVVFTSYMNEKYVVFKGYSGNRPFFTHNHYAHAKVARFGLGKMGGQHLVKAGGILTATLLCGFHVLDYFIRDTATLSQLIGNLGVDLAMVAISAGLTIKAVSGYLALGMSFALGPIAIAIIVGVGLAFAFGALEKRLQIKMHVIECLDWIGENVFKTSHLSGRLPLFDREYIFGTEGRTTKIEF